MVCYGMGCDRDDRSARSVTVCVYIYLESRSWEMLMHALAMEMPCVHRLFGIMNSVRVLFLFYFEGVGARGEGSWRLNRLQPR